MVWLVHLASTFPSEGLLGRRWGVRPWSWQAFSIAAALAVAAFCLRLWIAPWLTGAQFITFFPAVMVVTFLCGPPAGLMTVALSAGFAAFMLNPAGLTLQEALSLALFVAVALLDVAIVTAMLAANAALRASMAEVVKLNRDLRAEEGKFRDLLESAPDAMVIVDRQDRIVLVNAEAERLFGYPRAELLGAPVEQLMPARYRGHHGERVSAFMADPETRRMGPGLDLHALRKDGVEVPIETNLALLRGPDGDLVCGVIRDATQRKAAETRQLLLIHELNHRVKNTLTTVQAIASQALATTSSPAEFNAAFTARLQALAQSHDLLTRNQWAGASVRDLALEQLRPYDGGDGGRFHLTGPEVTLPPKLALALGMALSELATNAAKYGALSLAAGTIAIDWECWTENGVRRLRLIWTEQGGPLVKEPSRRGFGARLIERGLALELGGTTRLIFEPEGVVCEISFPLPEAAP
jgi:PAS domain S-box-containing protein